ncbi:hypothetical protein LPJ66_010167, partial [Kickxella alabastrina]
RVKRLNNARKDAAEDISKIQARKARELEEIQKKSVNQTELTESIQKETDERMVTIREQFEKNKQAAVAKIIEAVATADVASA